MGICYAVQCNAYLLNLFGGGGGGSCVCVCVFRGLEARSQTWEIPQRSRGP